MPACVFKSTTRNAGKRLNILAQVKIKIDAHVQIRFFSPSLCKYKCWMMWFIWTWKCQICTVTCPGNDLLEGIATRCCFWLHAGGPVVNFGWAGMHEWVWHYADCQQLWLDRWWKITESIAPFENPHCWIVERADFFFASKTKYKLWKSVLKAL